MEKNMKNKKSQAKFLSKIGICLALLFVIFLSKNASSISFAAEGNAKNEFCYLSDIPYVAKQSSSAWGKITLDQTSANALISVKVEGAAYTFEKGIWAHATSTVVYDLSEYAGYDYFTAYIGLNTTAASSSNGVKFYIYTSSDGKNWELKTDAQPAVAKAGQNATFVKVDIKNAKFLKLYANDNGSNGNDHAVYADAKLVKENYNDGNVVASVQEYDKKIKAYGNQDLSDEKFELLLLQRDFVNKAGQYALKRFASESEANKQTLSWLMNDVENLRLYIHGGTPAGGSYYNSLTQLARLYNEYSSDFTNNQLLNNKWYPNMTYGDLYKKMAITISLTHSQTVALWMHSGPKVNQSDALERYAIYKYLHDDGKLKASNTIDLTPLFEALQVEEMRFIMNNSIDDEEILWLNAYVKTKIIEEPNKAWLTPHPHMAYVWPDYTNKLYYENDDYFNDLFKVRAETLNKNYVEDINKTGLWDLKFKIPGGKNISEYEISITKGTINNKISKVWMNFRNKFGTGAVCGGISKSGSNIRATHGIPATVIGQPGHAALLFYSKDAQGRGYWGIDNDVSGWTLSEKGERMLLGWGNASYSKGYSVVYMVLAQEALNDYENLEKCEKMVMLADSYKGDLTKQEEIYRKALEIQPINIDAWYGLISVYNASTTKTEDEYFDLAKELAEKLKYFPLPMQHLTNLIKPKLTSIENQYRFTLLQTRILTEGSQTPNNTADHYYVYQPSVTRTEAKYLLGKLDKTIATFSFDGEDSGKIVLSSRFDGSGVRWDYSLDGKQTWNEVSFTAEEEHKLQLTPAQIASITAENDIYVHIVGVSYAEENLYKIDIQESSGLPSALFANDWENKFIAASPIMQWKYREEDKWTYYKDAEPNLTGDKTVIVRMGATGIYLAQKTTTTFNFTADNQPNTRKYIPISHLSIHSVSTEATSNQGAAANAIDGNANTRYHSAWNGTDTQRYITVKLDEPVYLSAVEFIPAGGGNGKIYDGTIYGSMDGENWEVLSKQKNLTYTNAADKVEQAIANIKSFEIDNPSKVQYVKIVADRTNGNWFAARMFNFYENTATQVAAKFSFDGENAGKIMLEDGLGNVTWKYSLDAGNTWKSGKGIAYQLTAEEISQINENDGIKIKLDRDGLEGTINIKKGNTPNITPYVNDWENRLIGLTNTNNLEWKMKENTKNANGWTSFSEKEPVVSGNRTLLVRAKATGIYTASEAIEYEFTENNETDTKKYIPIRRLSIAGFSAEDKGANGAAANAIDGNYNTRWLNSSAGTDTEKYIVVKLDRLTYLSAMDYVPHGENGKILNGKILGSIDGENFTEITEVVWANSEDLKTVEFEEPVQVQYVKIIGVETSYTNYKRHMGARMFNFYEDITKIEEPAQPVNATISYSTKTLTNQDVVATVAFDKEGITITNNEGNNTYTFMENGEFTFEFVDKSGNRGTAKATVNWIDKVAPNATITYSKTELTNQDVIATITFDKKNVTVTGGNTHTFTKNGVFTFEFVDKAGNKGTKTAIVEWIDKSIPVGIIGYNINKLTNQNVVATLLNANEDLTITNNGGSATYTFTQNGTFTFEFVSKAGNKGEVEAKVEWIDKTVPIANIEYSTRETTKENVIATVTFDEENVTITNNERKNTYIFSENGDFTFEFEDKAGNKGTAIAKVDWIMNEEPNDPEESENPDVPINPEKPDEPIEDEDTTAPTAKVIYDIPEKTTENVTATLTEESEEIIITNNDGSRTYTFTKNGEFTFEFEDKAGNKGTAIAKVDWIMDEEPSEPENPDIPDVPEDPIIDTVAPMANVEYSTLKETTGNVIATLVDESEEIIITNNDGSRTYTFTENGEFTFEFEDLAGNKGSKLAKVDWIVKDSPSKPENSEIPDVSTKPVVPVIPITPDESEDPIVDVIAPTARIEYSILRETTGNVIARLFNESEKIIVTNNNGSRMYTFTENGKFTFEFEDLAGNKGIAVAEVTWIKPSKPENSEKPYDANNSLNTDISNGINADKNNTNSSTANNGTQTNGTDSNTDTMTTPIENKNSVKTEQNNQKDNTFAGMLPYTGRTSQVVLIALGIAIVSAVIFFIKMKRNDEKE